MNIRRAITLAVFSLLFDGCGGSSHGPPPVEPLSINASGGGVTGPSLGSVGGTGAKISMFASGEMKIASSESGPPLPALPTPPSTGTELTNALITAGTPIAGNVLVTSTLQISAGVNPATITTNTGDVVILGSLIGERSAGTTTNAISISATAGTIYVLGTLRTGGTPGAVDNPHGGNITLTAQRVVITGTIDTSGEASVAGAGGNGGSLTINTMGGGGTDILLSGGSVRTAGGAAASQGGKGGDVSLQAGQQLAVFSPIDAGGGAASSLALTVIGGDGGNITLRGGSSADLWAHIRAAGGSASGYAMDANGGNGGSFTAGSAAPYRIFGSISTAGGSAATQVTGLNGGTAGPINIGVPTPVTTLEMGRGTYTTAGAWGSIRGGDAGGFDIATSDGNITVGGTLNAHGGESRTDGKSGGAISIKTDADAAGNSSNHTLTIAGTVDAGGGFGGNIGGNGAAVTLQSGGNLSITGSVLSAGAGFPGAAGPISIATVAANLPPTGALTITGSVIARGGKGQDDKYSGNADAVSLTGAAGVSFSGTLSTKGGSGPVTIQAAAGDITLHGSFDLSGAINLGGSVSDGADFTVTCAGSILFEGSIDVSGIGLDLALSNSPGSASGDVTMTSTGAGGTFTMLEGSQIRADGGPSSSGSSNHPGGAGGKLLISTVSGAVVLNGKVSAKGGAADMAASAGGLGGQVVVNSDSDGNGTGGAITLAADSEIDVSGGAGFTGGGARNNGGGAPADSSGANLAVVFDAGGSLTASPDGGTEGIVQNLGSIIATGNSLLGRGGDLWFDGKALGGANLGAGDGGTLTLTGPAGNGVFFPN